VVATVKRIAWDGSPINGYGETEVFVGDCVPFATRNRCAEPRLGLYARCYDADAAFAVAQSIVRGGKVLRLRNRRCDFPRDVSM